MKYLICLFFLFAICESYCQVIPIDTFVSMTGKPLSYIDDIFSKTFKAELEDINESKGVYTWNKGFNATHSRNNQFIIYKKNEISYEFVYNFVTDLFYGLNNIKTYYEYYENELKDSKYKQLESSIEDWGYNALVKNYQYEDYTIKLGKIASTNTATIKIIRNSNGTNCESINNFDTFHGLKLGNIFQDSIRKYFIIDKLDSAYIDFSLHRDKVAKNTKSFLKFNRWFYFAQTNFDGISISCLHDFRIFDFSLYSDYRTNNYQGFQDSIEIVNDRLPKTFIKISEELSRLLNGNPKTTKEKDLIGNHLHKVWECDKVKIVLSLWYNNKINSAYPSFTLITSLSITNKELENIMKLEDFKH